MNLSRPRPRVAPFRPRLEALEDRTLPAVRLGLGGAQTPVPNANIAVTNTGLSNEVEMVVAVNPANPRMVAAASAVRAISPGGTNTVTVFFSNDGGATWNANPLTDVGNDGNDGANDDGQAASFRFDPAIQFDPLGNLYVAYGATLNGRTQLVVARSTSSGATFNQFTVVDARADVGSLPGVDKWMLATGFDPSTGNPAVYVAYTQNVPEAVWWWTETDQRIVVAGSNNGGVSFTSPRTINDCSLGASTDSSNLFASPAVGPNGELFVVWHDVDAGLILLDRDLDGLFAGDHGFGDDIRVRSLRRSLFKTTSIQGDPVQAQPNRGIFAGPTLDIDRSGGPFHGRLYVAFVDVDSGTDSDVFVTTSADNGRNWTSRGILGDIDADTSTDFLPALAVDRSTGSVNVLFYTTSGDQNTGDNDVHVFLSTSTDAGETFRGRRMTTARSRANAANNGGRDFLEYIGLAVHDGTVHALWADNRGAAAGAFSADMDVFTASASFQSSTVSNSLVVTGRAGRFNDVITLGRSAFNPDFVEVRVNGALEFAGLLATLNSIRVDGGPGNDRIEVLTELGDVSITLRGGDDDDTFFVRPGSRVTVDGDGGSNTLQVNDSWFSFVTEYTINGEALTRGTAPSVRYSRVQALEVSTGWRGNRITLENAAGLDRVALTAGGSRDTIVVMNTNSATTTVRAGAGNDAIDLGTLTQIPFLYGALTVLGEDGLDTLSLYDQSVDIPMSYSLAATSLLRAWSRAVTFDATLEVLLLWAGDYADTVSVAATGPTGVTVNGGGGTNTLAKTGGINTWTITNANAGKLNGIVTFSGFANLTGGSSRDTFVFAVTELFPGDPYGNPPAPLVGSVTGTIDGGDGIDLLDYSAFTAAVEVDLAAEQATNANRVRQVENVTGGRGDDLLRGDARANTLRAGPGNDILLGGDGADVLYGDGGRNLMIGGTGADVFHSEQGEDILIGGATTRDPFDGMLRALLTEWARIDASYDTRVANLRNGGGRNGLTRLDVEYLVPDASVDTMFGATEVDWLLGG